jgi:SAM-dependent methyltransferase
MRTKSYGQQSKPSILDKAGQILSNFRIAKMCNSKILQGALLDIGCGYEARLTKPFWDCFHKIYLADVQINSKLHNNKGQKIIFLKGLLPDSLGSLKEGSIDVIIANNILEHLDNPLKLLKVVKNVASDNSKIYINVPSWMGKFFLEKAAFKLNLAPRDEMEDHKNYYDKKNLWTLVRSAGFLPSQIKIKYTKLGLNTTCWITNAK